MIREVTGDILETDVEALVNPVNTVGVMAAGLALQVKRKYPGVFREYAAACRLRKLQAGQVMAHSPTPFRWVINFPTKVHWRDPSRIEWIDTGLTTLRETIVSLEIHSIAVPALGCGLGGLPWISVRELIYVHLGDLNDVDVELYVPGRR